MFHKIKRVVRNLSYKSEGFKSIYSLLNRAKINILSKVSDEKYAKFTYKENTGKSLNLKSPKTFNEKLWWLKLNNRDPLLTRCSDKVEVRSYIDEMGLGEILIPMIGVYKKAEDIDFNTLPDKAFIKTNHGSGINVLWDRHKSFDKERFIKKFNKALKINYYLQSREWNYRDISPRIIVEEVLEPTDSNFGLIDYKFLCFEGKVKLVLTDVGVAAPDGTHSPEPKRNIHSRDFELINLKIGRENFHPCLRKPKNYEKMLKYAEEISKPFPHCRVDLYNNNGEIFFGEITFYHGGATQKIEPNHWDLKIGDWIDLESQKIYKKSGDDN